MSPLKTKTSQPRASIIIPCKNEGSNVRMTVDSILSASPVCPIEIIVIDDGSADDSCRFLQKEDRYHKVNLITTPGLGASRARNLGASTARGEYLIFCDAHITVPEGWPESLLNTFRTSGVDAVSPAIGSLENPTAAGYGQTWNELLETVWLPPPTDMKATAVPLLPGGCLAVRTEVFLSTGGFDKGFTVWGYEDVELSLKMWLFGYDLYVNPSVKVLHLFRKKHPYPVTMEHVHYNLLRMAYSHFNVERIDKILDLIKSNGQQPQKIVGRVLKEGALEQRLHYFARRKRDDNWFMKKFRINF